MNSKELLLSALRNEATERVPWVPFVGCHAASLLGISAEEFFKSKDHIVNGVVKAYEEYRPDGLPVLFDLQLEAEALGCRVRYNKDNPPFVISHPIEDGATIAELSTVDEQAGRFPLALAATRELVAKLGDKIAVYGLVTGPFTLAMHLAGTEFFYQMIDEPDEAKALIEFCEGVCKQTARMYIEAGADVIALVDPVTSQISKDNFDEFVGEAATRIFGFIREKGALSSFFVCGNATRNIESMCACRPDNVSIDENIDLAYVKEVAGRHNVSFGGNIQLTVTMLFGSELDNIRDAKNCCAVGGNKGFILAPGCDMPFATPPNNVKAVASFVHGEEVGFLESASVLDGIEVDIPDYARSERVIVDVVTLDSESCAPCQYMMAAIESACSGLESIVSYTERKYKVKETAVFMRELSVKHIPTILMDGEVVFESIIPPTEQIKREIEVRYEKKRER